VAANKHRRELSDCMSGYQSCDHSKLSGSEAKALSIAERQRNLSNCEEGWDSCDKSKLSKLEVSGVADAEHKRNLSHCMDGWAVCDHSKLTDAEANGAGLSNHDISKQLNVTDSTIDSCVAWLLVFLDYSNRPELVVRAASSIAQGS
jgi:hypothetical protein